mmetsp:Transcript_13433/g.22484  ORF Transcript_13433/g.22484 Transcript_13433/m.22484 type:complete len:735 (+) Transcript_13433:1543-3747(+)
MDSKDVDVKAMDTREREREREEAEAFVFGDFILPPEPNTAPASSPSTTSAMVHSPLHSDLDLGHSLSLLLPSDADAVASPHIAVREPWPAVTITSVPKERPVLAVDVPVNNEIVQGAYSRSSTSFSPQPAPAPSSSSSSRTALSPFVSSSSPAPSSSSPLHPQASHSASAAVLPSPSSPGFPSPSTPAAAASAFSPLHSPATAPFSMMVVESTKAAEEVAGQGEGEQNDHRGSSSPAPRLEHIHGDSAGAAAIAYEVADPVAVPPLSPVPASTPAPELASGSTPGARNSPAPLREATPSPPRLPLPFSVASPSTDRLRSPAPASTSPSPEGAYAALSSPLSAEVPPLPSSQSSPAAPASPSPSPSSPALTYFGQPSSALPPQSPSRPLLPFETATTTTSPPSYSEEHLTSSLEHVQHPSPTSTTELALSAQPPDAHEGPATDGDRKAMAATITAEAEVESASGTKPRISEGEGGPSFTDFPAVRVRQAGEGWSHEGEFRKVYAAVTSGPASPSVQASTDTSSGIAASLASVTVALPSPHAKEGQARRARADVVDADGTLSEAEGLLVAQAGVEAVMAFEKSQGRRPVECDDDAEGWDITSYATNNGDTDAATTTIARRIEVKAMRSAWGNRGVTLSGNQWRMALLHMNEYYVYVVEEATSQEKRVVYVFQNPAAKVTGVSLDMTWKQAADYICTTKLEIPSDIKLHSQEQFPPLALKASDNTTSKKSSKKKKGK